MGPTGERAQARAVVGGLPRSDLVPKIPLLFSHRVTAAVAAKATRARPGYGETATRNPKDYGVWRPMRAMLHRCEAAHRRKNREGWRYGGLPQSPRRRDRARNRTLANAPRKLPGTVGGPAARQRRSLESLEHYRANGKGFAAATAL